MDNGFYQGKLHNPAALHPTFAFDKWFSIWKITSIDELVSMTERSATLYLQQNSAWQQANDFFDACDHNLLASCFTRNNIIIKCDRKIDVFGQTNQQHTWPCLACGSCHVLIGFGFTACLFVFYLYHFLDTHCITIWLETQWNNSQLVKRTNEIMVFVSLKNWLSSTFQVHLSSL